MRRDRSAVIVFLRHRVWRDGDAAGRTWISGPDATDWLVRSAVPRFLVLAERPDDAATLRDLPSLVRLERWHAGAEWSGANARMRALELELRATRRRLLRLSTKRPASAPSTAEVRTRSVCAFVRRYTMPSRLGATGYRLIEQCALLTGHVAHIAADPDGQALVERAWGDAWQTLRDRTLFRDMVESLSTHPRHPGRG